MYKKIINTPSVISKQNVKTWNPHKRLCTLLQFQVFHSSPHEFEARPAHTLELGRGMEGEGRLVASTCPTHNITTVAAVILYMKWNRFLSHHLDLTTVCNIRQTYCSRVMQSEACLRLIQVIRWRKMLYHVHAYNYGMLWMTMDEQWNANCHAFSRLCIHHMCACTELSCCFGLSVNYKILVKQETQKASPTMLNFYLYKVKVVIVVISSYFLLW